jgi:membrane protein
LKAVVRLLAATIHSWREDKAPRLGAALAYYTIFSIPPLLMLLIGMASLVFGREAVEGRIVGTIQGLIGAGGAAAIQDMLRNAHASGHGLIATVIGFVTLLLGASGVVSSLKDALNTIWEIEPKPGRGVLAFLKDYIFSMSLALAAGFLLLVSLAVSAALAALGDYLGRVLPGGAGVWGTVNVVLSVLVIGFLFAVLFKYLPSARVAWKDVLLGGLFTSVLFTVGETLIGLYLGRTKVGSAFGAAGSLVVILVWVYYSSMILFFGAEFTQAYARLYGSRIVPDRDARPVADEQREQQGIPRRQGASRPFAPGVR